MPKAKVIAPVATEKESNVAGIAPVASSKEEISAVYASILNILDSKVRIDEHLNREVELSVTSDGITLDRGVYLYNTNVTTNDRLNRALDACAPDEFFAEATSKVIADEMKKTILNGCSVSLTTLIGRGEKLLKGETIVCRVNEYESKKTNKMEFGLTFVRKVQAIALKKEKNSRLAEFRALVATNDPFED